MQCVILAGGMGTRMQNVLKGQPKSLLPIHERPFLYYQLTWLARQGITEVVLCIGYGGADIQRYAGDGRTWGLSLRYVDEGGDLRGTGGALRLAYDKGFLEPGFFVTYGDSFLPIPFAPIWAAFQSQAEPALMVVLKNEGRWEKSNARFDGKKVVLYDKKQAASDMLYVDYGLLALKAEVIKQEIPSGQVYDVAELLHRLSVGGDLAGYEAHKRFFEVGSPGGLADFSAFLTKEPLS
jgi:NDP-sugar pyrophosphorylase family protein